MTMFKANVYMQPVENELQGSHPKQQLEVPYKNFMIRKRNDFPLYRIEPPISKVLHKALDGEYTKMEVLKATIDHFLLEHSFQDAFLDPPEAKRKVGRPRK